MSVADTTSQPAKPRSRFGADVRFLHSELRIMTGRRRNQIGVAALAALPVVVAIGTYAATSGTDRSGGSGSVIDSFMRNGLLLGFAALLIELPFFLPAAVAVLSADSIASEAQLGTLRYLLTVPVTRTRLLITKLIALVIGTLLGVCIVAGSGLIAGAVFFGVGPLPTLSGSELPYGETFLRLGIAIGYVTLCLAAFGCIGLFISTLTEVPIAAMISSLAVVMIMNILLLFDSLDWLHPFLLVTQWSSFIDVLRDPIFSDNMINGLLVSLAYAVIFASLAWVRLSNKDITS